MCEGLKFAKIAGIALLCVGTLNADTSAQHSRRKTAKKPATPPADLPSGPTGRAVPQVPLDSIAPVSPQVNYQNGQLTIVAPNSTLADVLRAVHRQTGAEIEIPAATDRVVTRLGPGPARDVMADLLNGSRFNYVLLGSPQDPNALTRIVLVAKSGPGNAPPAGQIAPQQRPPAQDQAEAQAPQQPEAEENNEAVDAPEENADDNNGEQPAEAEQPAQPSEQPGIKTPQQMLQEMQQRQLQMQQQQPGQPPVPAPGYPPPSAQPQQQDQ